jgi:hypothetical protein
MSPSISLRMYLSNHGAKRSLLLCKAIMLFRPLASKHALDRAGQVDLPYPVPLDA